MSSNEERQAKKALNELSRACFVFLRRLDEVMVWPESVTRGEQIAQLTNALEMANDRVRFGQLGVDFRKDDKDAEWKRLRTVEGD